MQSRSRFSALLVILIMCLLVGTVSCGAKKKVTNKEEYVENVESKTKEVIDTTKTIVTNITNDKHTVIEEETITKETVSPDGTKQKEIKQKKKTTIKDKIEGSKQEDSKGVVHKNLEEKKTTEVKVKQTDKSREPFSIFYIYLSAGIIVFIILVLYLLYRKYKGRIKWN